MTTFTELRCIHCNLQQRLRTGPGDEFATATTSNYVCADCRRKEVGRGVSWTEYAHRRWDPTLDWEEEAR